MQRDRVNIALSVQLPLALAASRVGVVGSVVAAALTVYLHGCYAVCGCGTKYRCGALLGVTYGDMLESMARITPSQPNDAMARIASRRNRTISLDPHLPDQIFREIL